MFASAIKNLGIQLNNLNFFIEKNIFYFKLLIKKKKLINK